MEKEDGGSGTDSQVRLRLITRERDLTLDETAPILVPTTFRRYQLSTLVNSLLEKERPVPLEFLINGTYLRTSLDEYLTENGISAETTLAVEYVRARIPPQFVASFEHDDWIGDVDILSATSPAASHLQDGKKPSQSRILTASYDGRLRVWNTSAQVLTTSPGQQDGGHASFIKSAKFVNPNQVVSASFDRSIRLWKFSGEDETSASLTPQIELYGHKSGIESVCAHASSHRLLSASSDHSVGLWSTRKSDAPSAPESLIPRMIAKEGKRRKLNSSVSVPQKGALSLMQQHTAPVMGVTFDSNDATVGYSASLDHTVRTWDLVRSSLVDTRTLNSALYCIQHLQELHLLACGSAGRDVKLVDPRVSAATVTAMSLRGHKNHVVSLARDPNSEYGLLSGSHDGTCRIWDVRSTKNSKDGVSGQSTFTINRQSLGGSTIPMTGEGVKVFAVCWDSQLGILSGGEDKALQINSSEGL